MSTQESPDLFIFAGEASGDLHGARLLQALRQLRPSLRVCGVGGPKMRAEDLSCLIPMEEFQVMGFSDVFRALPKLFRNFKLVKRAILSLNPKAVVFIDYPGFNLRMAKALRKAGFKGKLIHYICPSVWAWKKNRVHGMVATLDLLMTIYPFESSLFAQTPLRSVYVGNPIFDELKVRAYDEKWVEKLGIDNTSCLIGMFPGSRHGALKLNLDQQMQTAVLLHQKHPELRFALSIAHPSLEPFVRKTLAKYPLTEGKELFLVPPKDCYNIMRHCRAAIATSGTVTLELALHRVPTLVTYRLSLLNWFIAKFVVGLNLAHYCIVNIILGKTVFPELLNFDFSLPKACELLTGFIKDGTHREGCLDGCDALRKALECEHPSQKAALAILSQLES